MTGKALVSINYVGTKICQEQRHSPNSTNSSNSNAQLSNRHTTDALVPPPTVLLAGCKRARHSAATALTCMACFELLTRLVAEALHIDRVAKEIVEGEHVCQRRTRTIKLLRNLLEPWTAVLVRTSRATAANAGGRRQAAGGSSGNSAVGVARWRNGHGQARQGKDHVAM